MSSTIDPAKLKVIDLRAELTSRGLDPKGNKAVLVKRLKDALEKELKQDLPNTSIADTSTEDLDTSQTEEKSEETSKSDKSAAENMEVDESASDEKEDKTNTVKTESKTPAKVKTDVKSPEKAKSGTVTKSQSPEKAEAIKTESPEKTKPSQVAHGIPEPSKAESKAEENGEHSEAQDEENSHKSDQQSTDAKDADEDSAKAEKEPEQKGEKRRRSSPSPERSQRRRSRSPVKEDEPALDNDKVQLSWYDSDLHLQLDKESFLSAKPLTEGAFGFAWAGVRATHGVSAGKVCYEVKLTEELKWEDLSKYDHKGGRDRYRPDHRKYQRRDRDRRDSEKKSGEKSKTENGEAKDTKPEEKEEKPAEEKGNTDSEKKPEETSENVDDSVKTEEKSVQEDETPKESSEKTKSSAKTEETPMETDPTEEKKSDSAENKSKSDEEKIETEESKTEESKTEVPSEPMPTHIFRVGWSLVGANLQLGEEKYSYGFESTGKFITDKQFSDYGTKFGVGDVVGAYLSIDDENVVIRYSVNGELQPIATTVPKSDFSEDDFALFPHVLSRNYAFELNLGDKEEPWFPIPSELEDYSYLSKVENKISGPTRPENRGECEVLLMCGLPSSGKTHWVQEHVSSNPDRRFTVLGNTTLLQRMTVSGEPLKGRYKGSWSSLVDKIQKCLNRLISLAALRRRNYIIDQTNVFPSAQRRKMRPFEGFKRRAVIVVVGDEEQARRQSLQEAQDGKDVPDSTILEMKAAMALPEKGDWIDEVTYAELDEAEAKEIVKKYNAAAREAGYDGERRFARKDGRWQNRRNDYRGGKNYRERSYQNQRYDPRGPRQGGWSSQRSGSGSWNRDRRDNRGSGGRDWRGSGRDRDSRSQGGNYNRSHSQSGGRGQGSWSGGSWAGQGGWNSQTFGSRGGGYGGNQNWGGQWKYGGGSGNSGSGGQGYGGYGNYSYGQYGQNWSSQK